MEKKKGHFLVKLIAIALVISLCAPIGAQAAMPETAQPMASAYLMSYTAYICAMGNGDLEIWWEVTGTGTWADIGVLTISLYESTNNSSFYWVESFDFTVSTNMLWHNNYFCVMLRRYAPYKGV